MVIMEKFMELRLVVEVELESQLDAGVGVSVMVGIRTPLWVVVLIIVVYGVPSIVGPHSHEGACLSLLSP